MSGTFNRIGNFARALIFAGVVFFSAGHCFAGTVTYTYDALGRLASAAFSDGTCTAYAYDAAGNRTQYTVSGGGPPTANSVSATAFQDLSATFDPRLSDPSCASLTVSAVGPAGHGATAIASGGVGVVYTPSAGYFGTDSFTYTVNDGHQSSSPGQVMMTVQKPTLAPVALDAGGRFVRTIPPPPSVTPVITVDVTSRISDPYGYVPTVVSNSTPASGTVIRNGAVFTYTFNQSINTNFATGDSFTYTISDGHGNTATATVSLRINVRTQQ